MPTYQESVNELTNLINEYITVRNLLFTNKYAYDNDAFTRRYNVREMAFTIFAASQAAKKCNSYYKEIFFDSKFTKAQRKIFSDQFAIFQTLANSDGIIPTLPAPLLEQITLGSFSGNVTKTVQQLHLIEELLKGFLKMGDAAQGKYLQLIISYTRSSGVATIKDELMLDIDVLLTHLGLVGHIAEHEIGHRDYAQYYGQSGPLNVTNLPFYRPSFITDDMTQPQRNEILADLYSAIVASIFGIPLDDPFSRFMNQITPPTPGTLHPGANQRALIAQEVVSTLTPLFNNKTSIWYPFAQAIRDIAGIQFADIPSFGDLDKIIEQYPSNKVQQKAALKAQFPKLSLPSNRGEYPPVARVDRDIFAKLANPALIVVGPPANLVNVEQFQEANKNAQDPRSLSTSAFFNTVPLTQAFTSPDSPMASVTSDAPSTVAPSTVAPSTARPSTAAPSTAAPSTATPSTVAPSKKKEQKKSSLRLVRSSAKAAKKIQQMEQMEQIEQAQVQPLLFSKNSPVNLVPLLPLPMSNLENARGYYQVPLPPSAQPPLNYDAPIVTNFMLGRVAWELFKNTTKTLAKRWNAPAQSVAFQSAPIDNEETVIRYLRA